MNRLVLLMLLMISVNAFALTKQQLLFKKTYNKALKGNEKAVIVAKKQLKDYLLVHYLDYALIRSKITKLPIKEIKDFKKNHPKSPLNNVLKNLLVYELGKQKKWSEYLSRYKDNKSSQTKHCWYLQARIDTKKLKGLNQAIENTWMNGLSLPSACNSVFKWWEQKGQLTDDKLEKRINLAFKVNNASTARYLAAKMKKKSTWVKYAIKLMQAPDKTLKQSLKWHDNPQNRELIFRKCKSLASKRPDYMHKTWAELKKHFSFSAKQLAQVERTIALYAATDYLPFTIDAMNKLSPSYHDAQIYAWKVRYYLYTNKWREVYKTIKAMPDFQRNKDNWQYWYARSSAKIGKKENAKKIFARLAKKTNYYGFLSADHMQLPYQFCTNDIPATPIKKLPLASQRAFELFELDMIHLARKEWMIGYRQLKLGEKRSLAEIALQKGWYNKTAAIMAAIDLKNNYPLRYPLGYKAEITKFAKQYKLLPQWIMSIITQESAWQTDAISRADARGLMQLIHPTAERLSKKLKLNYWGKQQLHEANFNLQLGIFYQKELFARFNHPVLALASYNAGETKGNHWLRDFPTSPDMWAETIPYRETRDYIVKILTNVTIYDWLIHQTPKRISYWLPTMPVNGKKIKPWPSKKTAAQTTTGVCNK